MFQDLGPQHARVTHGRPQAVLWDKKNPALLYVFDAPGDPRAGKIVIRANHQGKVKEAGKRPKVGKKKFDDNENVGPHTKIRFANMMARTITIPAWPYLGFSEEDKVKALKTIKRYLARLDA